MGYLEPWIREGYIKLLLPKIILDEWEKHSEEQGTYRERKLKNIFVMPEEILPSAFFSDYKSTASQKQIISNQIARIESILRNAELIPINDEIQKKYSSGELRGRPPCVIKEALLML